jgi:hypothetical protein
MSFEKVTRELSDSWTKKKLFKYRQGVRHDGLSTFTYIIHGRDWSFANVRHYILFDNVIVVAFQIIFILKYM